MPNRRLRLLALGLLTALLTLTSRPAHAGVQPGGDDRLNSPAAPVAVYCVPGGVSLWNINDGGGEFAAFADGGLISAALASAHHSGERVQVAAGPGDSALWALPSPELQANQLTLQATRHFGDQPDYNFTFAAGRCIAPDLNAAPLPSAAPETPVVAAAPTEAAPVIGPALPEERPPAALTYTVRPGDNLFRIALRYGTTVEAIAALNQLSDPRQITTGQQLTIPGQAAGSIPPADPITTPPADPIDPTGPVEPVEATPLPEITPPGDPVAGNRIAAWEYHHTTFDMSARIKMTPAWFAEQLRWLYANGYYTVTSEELAAYVEGRLQLPARSVVLTFDLGTWERADYETIVAQLQRYGLHGIFFLVTDAVTDDCRGDSHCWTVLRRWQATGAVSYGSHSVSHPRYSDLSPARRLDDLLRSKQIIEAELGPIVGFAYPFENVPAGGMESLLREAGYAYAFGGWSRGDFSIYANDPMWYNLPRLLPYSTPDLYPVLSARANGLTFGEVMGRFVMQ